MSESVHRQHHDNEPWYRQFWPWFLIALPASVVVAGITTVIIAVNKADSLVVDDYYKQGLGINRVLAEDEAARRLGLAATLDVDISAGDLALSLQGEQAAAAETLSLRWIHPAYSDEDFTITLQSLSAGHYVGQLPVIPEGRWYLQLHGDVPEAWRLRVELVVDERVSVQF